MKILKSSVDWYEGYINLPTLKCLVDKLPDMDQIRYTKNGNFYWGQCDGYVNFYYHDKNNQEGFGGREFLLNMDDGNTKVIKGPWSSSSSAMNTTFPHSVECSITDDPLVWEKGSTYYSGYITLNIAQEAARLANVFLVRNKDCIAYSPSLRQDIIIKPFLDGYMYFPGNHKNVVTSSIYFDEIPF